MELRPWLALAFVACSTVRPLPSRALQWRRSADRVTLLADGAPLWSFCTDAARGKPCFHPLALPGSEPLTLDAPKDHPWHHGLWFSWKLIDGVNYWENERATGLPAGRTSWHVTAVRCADDGSARFALELDYAPADGDVALRERRVVEVTPPGADGGYAIDWDSTFVAARDCLLDRTPLPGEPGGQVFGGYAGLSLRLADLAEREVTTEQGPVEWNAQDRCRPRALALDYSGRCGDRTVGIAILTAPDGFRAPSPWYAIRSQNMSFCSPAVLCFEPLRLRHGERLRLCYRVGVHAGRWDAARLRRELAAFGAAPPRDR